MFQKVSNRKIVSDEGYAVELVGRHDLIYQEGSKSLKFYVESWKPKADILLDTSGAQDALGGEESLDPLAKEEMQRIISNITAALGHMGLTVCVHGYPADRSKSAARPEYTIRFQKPARIEYSEGNRVYVVEGRKRTFSNRILVKFSNLSRTWQPPYSNETISDEKLKVILGRLKTALRNTVIFE